MGQNQQISRTESEGLSNLAYASGLEAAGSRSNASRNTQQFSSMAQQDQQQNRVRSPIDNQPRYAVNPPSATSYPMQQQTSTSSNSSQQLAVNAAAASAGAVNRRYTHQHHGKATTTSPNIPSARAATSNSQPRRTESPQMSTMNNTNSLYSATQQQTSDQSKTQPPPYPANQHSMQSTSTSRSTPGPPQPQQPSSQSSTRQAPNPGAQQQRQSSTRDIQQASSIANLVSAAHETESGSYTQGTVENAPHFIDPTAVFDPYHRERERKRQEAAAEAKRKAEEDAVAEQLRKQRDKEAEEDARRKKLQDEAEAQKRQVAAKAAKPSSRKSKSRPSGTAAPTAPAPPEITEEEKMALELKAMMEKMKSFQSKDPSLFKKLWNDMRQPGSGAAANAGQSPSPQIAPQALPRPPASAQSTLSQQTPAPQTPAQVDGSNEIASTGKRKKAQTGPDGNPLHLNGYPVIVENNPEGLPDLGRFPAERRIRPNKYIRKDGSAEHSVKQSAAAAASVSPPASATPSRPSSSKRIPASKGQATPAALVGAFGAATENAIPADGSLSKPNAGTVWPLEKRNALTATALKALKANPENANISLTEDDLRKLLENNPSYLTLCEMLEQRGLKFYRGHFARELLNSVPELKTPGPGQKPMLTTAGTAAQIPVAGQSVSRVQSSHAPPPEGYPVPPPGYMVQWHESSAAPHPAPAGHFVPAPNNWGQGILHPGQGPAPPSALKTPKVKGAPFRIEPPLGSKEAAARKRDFSELIDLTELGDDDNYVVPDKYPRLEEPDSDIDMEDNFLQKFQKPTATSHYDARPVNGIYPGPPQVVKFDPLQPQPYLTSSKKQEADAKTTRMILAKTLNKGEALRKQYYDPKTVARDILIASGRHPSERPLNVHLAGMLGKYIDLDSDVSTFEWDEIDPGGPPLASVEQVDIPATKPRFKLGDRVKKRKHGERPRPAIDKTRVPELEKRQVTAAPSSPAKPAAPATPSPGDHSQVAKTKKPSGLRHSLLANDANATPATADPTRAPLIQSDRSAPGSQRKPAMNETLGPKKRGRPFGSKNKYPSLGGLRDQAAATTGAGVRINLPPREPTPGREKFKCKWKKCSTILHNLDTLRKHIGRVHRPSTEDVANEGYTCWWKKCKYLTQNEDGDWETTKTFDHWEDWLKHIERDHITAIAMKYGDGPSIAHVGKQT